MSKAQAELAEVREAADAEAEVFKIKLAEAQLPKIGCSKAVQASDDFDIGNLSSSNQKVKMNSKTIKDMEVQIAELKVQVQYAAKESPAQMEARQRKMKLATDTLLKVREEMNMVILLSNHLLDSVSSMARCMPPAEGDMWMRSTRRLLAVDTGHHEFTEALVWRDHPRT